MNRYNLRTSQEEQFPIRFMSREYKDKICLGGHNRCPIYASLDNKVRCGETQMFIDGGEPITGRELAKDWARDKK